MKQPNRYLTRQAIFQALFESDFRNNDPLENFDRVFSEIGDDLDDKFAHNVINAVTKNGARIDEYILEAAPDWPIEKVSRVDKVVLRISLAELFYRDEIEDTPTKVVINEAVEIAKRFGSESSSKFVNGVLGTLYRKYLEDKEKNE